MIWVVAGIALAVAEVFTASFVLIMFTPGALAAALSAALGAPVPVQFLVFAVVSLLSVAVVRPAVKRHLNRRPEEGASFGMEAIEDSTATVLERVDVDKGVVKIDGELWQARALDAAQVFEPGERVRVVQVKGVTAMVWRD